MFLSIVTLSNGGHDILVGDNCILQFLCAPEVLFDQLDYWTRRASRSRNYIPPMPS
jgi:hypothetical protein